MSHRSIIASCSVIRGICTGENTQKSSKPGRFEPADGESIVQTYKGSLRRIRRDLLFGGIVVTFLGWALPQVTQAISNLNLLTYVGIVFLAAAVILYLLGKRYYLYVTNSRLVQEWVSARGRRVRFQDHPYNFFESITLAENGVGAKTPIAIDLSSGTTLAFALPGEVAEAILAESRGFLNGE